MSNSPATYRVPYAPVLYDTFLEAFVYDSMRSECMLSSEIIVKGVRSPERCSAISEQIINPSSLHQTYSELVPTLLARHVSGLGNVLIVVRLFNTAVVEKRIMEDGITVYEDSSTASLCDVIAAHINRLTDNVHSSKAYINIIGSWNQGTRGIKHMPETLLVEISHIPFSSRGVRQIPIATNEKTYQDILELKTANVATNASVQPSSDHTPPPSPPWIISTAPLTQVYSKSAGGGVFKTAYEMPRMMRTALEIHKPDYEEHLPLEFLHTRYIFSIESLSDAMHTGIDSVYIPECLDIAKQTGFFAITVSSNDPEWCVPMSMHGVGNNTGAGALITAWLNRMKKYIPEDRHSEPGITVNVLSWGNSTYAEFSYA